MKAVVCTHCSDDVYETSYCRLLENSFRHFHPDIPLVTFKTEDLNRLAKPWDFFHIIPNVCLTLADQYDLVVHMDADSIVTARLDEVLNPTWELACVLDNTQDGKRIDSLENLANFKGINAGLVASTRKDFWELWKATNEAQWEWSKELPFYEQSHLNNIFYSGKFNGVILERLHPASWFGVVSRYSPEAWQEIQCLDDQLWIEGRRIKILHQAAGFPKQSVARMFCGKTREFVERVTR